MDEDIHFVLHLTVSLKTHFVSGKLGFSRVVALHFNFYSSKVCQLSTGKEIQTNIFEFDAIEVFYF